MKSKITKKLNQKGFTLVELLVVIVILGILAALVVPRLLNQTRQAETAEAVQMLGSLRRNITSFVDSSNGANVPAIVANNAGDAGWTRVGMSPLPATSRYVYATAGGALAGLNATATRVGDANGVITMNLETGALACTGTSYTPVTDAAGDVVRCAVA